MTFSVISVLFLICCQVFKYERCSKDEKWHGQIPKSCQETGMNLNEKNLFTPSCQIVAFHSICFFFTQFLVFDRTSCKIKTIDGVFHERVSVKARINYQTKYELLLIYIMVQ